ncbi:bacillithiol biosynthesis cysteine-adding enzyme BshC [Sporocytophaga myxococcoides]|uniref:bacillithiol biosynthesis cysteine-adding enzyme BshC n=1 Tax=Sporocytophaga myxococcoides TaxID=153721 RepID=UPI00041B9B5B|nr:bacillithiol biosynthesis cysteine-adding enzyme BshC [Sporocytophaga myxococcoides]
MKILSVEAEKTGAFSKLYLDYISKKEDLSPFYNLFPSIENIEQQIGQKKFNADQRVLLTDALKRQYSNIVIKEAASKSIGELLNDNTFTITTGHQLNLFTGPLYLIYKTIAIIKACEILKRKYPKYSFVPVFWIASEDHDFAEINHFHLFGKTYTWETQQKGAVGRLSCEGIEKILNELPEKVELFQKAYLEKGRTLAEATRYILNELFGDYGLIVLDGDDISLKQVLKPVIKEEIEGDHVCKIVENATKSLETLGYTGQIFPREINLFYLKEGLRERLIIEGDNYRVNNTNIVYSKSEILRLAEEQPEAFSPNVVLRPLYQEMLLPNLAYVGGPAEVTYWLQLKKVFNHFGVTFPMLMPRLFFLIINSANSKKISKLNINEEDLFKSALELKELYLEKHSSEHIETVEEHALLDYIFKMLQTKAADIDPTLVAFTEAEAKRAGDIINNVEKRFRKALEKKHEQGIQQLLGLKEKLFPANTLQERYDNFLNFYINDPDLINKLMIADPFDFRFKVLLPE